MVSDADYIFDLEPFPKDYYHRVCKYENNDITNEELDSKKCC